ncbi:hypothetical protein [uncultured Duncaniella sp.]|uniref:hypothetical protein n=1 Tax=uncultured Duncaniella sp. TaxID=2768039 RepID=UPI00272AE62A|nr:hypothetical protein [uncultured Duncaniella sp.]
MKLSTYWNDLKKCMLLVIIGGIVGWLLLIAVYLLPIEPMERNVKKALDELVELGPAPKLISDNQAARLDIYSDSVMLNEAIYRGEENIWVSAVGGYEYIYEGKTAFQSLLAYLSGETGGKGVEYARYWHGYLVFLKPLLTIFSYGDIKGINLLFQMLMLGLIIVELSKRKLNRYAYAFLLAIYSLMPLAVTMCLEYSIVFNITLISCAVMLVYYERIMDKKIINLFYATIGMVVCYCDLLTYPLVALGYVLVINIMLECSNNRVDRLKIVCGVLERSFFWGCGYIGIWGIKWILASVFLRQNIVKEAILFVLYRASTEASDSGVSEDISRIQALSLNIKTIIVPVLLIALGVSLFWVLFKYLKMKRLYIDSAQIIGELIVAVLPFIWVAFTANHAYVHYWMVYREFSITVFAIVSIIISLVCTPNISGEMSIEKE